MERLKRRIERLSNNQKVRCSIRLGDEDFVKVNHFKGDSKNGFKQIPTTIIIWPRNQKEAEDIVAKIKATDHIVLPKILLKDLDTVSKVIRFGLAFASLGTRKAFWGGPGRPDIEDELQKHGIFIREE